MEEAIYIVQTGQINLYLVDKVCKDSLFGNFNLIFVEILENIKLVERLTLPLDKLTPCMVKN